jgi:hypothetical protein
VARITVLLPEPTGDTLCALADQEWRRPADQAAYLITEALRHRGVLVPDPPVAARMIRRGRRRNDGSL